MPLNTESGGEHRQDAGMGRVVEAFHYRPDELFRLGLTGGDVAQSCYERLARHAEAQIDWSRVYMAGHVPSDLEGGALLGDMIGEYFLATRA